MFEDYSKELTEIQDCLFKILDKLGILEKNSN